jgi:hypothetical protein
MKTSKYFVSMVTGYILTVTAGCGTEQINRETNSQHEGAPYEQPGLPDGAVIAVPLDKNGQELTHESDLRLLPSSQKSLTGEAIRQAFESGRRPDKVLDEMDMTSSTESFQGWGNYRHVGRPGYSPGFNRFQPIYYHGGHPYAWRYSQQYRCRNVNYYYYHRQPRPWAHPSWTPQRPTHFPQRRTGQFGQVQPIGYY